MTIELVFRNTSEESEPEVVFSVTAIANQITKQQQIVFTKIYPADRSSPIIVSKYLADSQPPLSKSDDDYYSQQADMEFFNENLLDTGVYSDDECAWLTSLAFKGPYGRKDDTSLDIVNLAMLRLLTGQSLPRRMVIDDHDFSDEVVSIPEYKRKLSIAKIATVMFADDFNRMVTRFLTPPTN